MELEQKIKKRNGDEDLNKTRSDFIKTIERKVVEIMTTIVRKEMWQKVKGQKEDVFTT